MVRIGVVLQGDLSSPGTWSGVPAGVISGLTAVGVEVVPIEARFPRSGALARVLRMSGAQQKASRAFAAGSGLTADLAIRRAGALDGIVMMGSGFSLSTRVPIISYDDMTVVQALASGYPNYRSLSVREGRRWRERQRRIYQRIRGCCVGSRWAARSIRDDYGIDEERVHVVGFGHNFDGEPAERSWDTPHYLFVGGDWERKRGPAVVEAFAAVRSHHPEATLDLVGGHPRIDAPGVIGHGMLPLGEAEGRMRLRSLHSRATCHVLPSAAEPFGLAYLDAAAYGVASIGTTVGGAPDAIGDGGRVVDPEDPAALVAAMLELADPAIARELGERARERAGMFTWRAVAERLLRALHPPGVDVAALAPFLYSRQTESGAA